ncbi:MAG: hypothetical protein E5Y63_26955 [Mesorhizobium sp.]|uniref:hypothetical protein n=1 Tax=Mesorhizobium sp. TaxID=1871066 RepID=UPI00121E22A9|nr:hypothetical protein [Mesorhizobium sp.]TIM26866.1 MAG: hypothetical protein E5Y63_26955 [Mesorhizobium sp.]
MFLLVPPECHIMAIGPGQPDIAELGVWIRFDRLEAQLPHQLVPRGRESTAAHLGNSHQVIVERADLRGVALWQGALDPAPDPIRKRADDLLLDDEEITDLAVVGVSPQMRSVIRIQQLGGHLQPVSDLLLAAFEQVVDAEFISDLPGVGGLVALPETRVPGDDGVSLAPRKLGDDPLGDGVAEISLIRAGTHVIEGKDRNPRHVAH